MTERDLFLIYHTHKIMIAPSAHESIHRMLSVLRFSSKWRKRVSAHRISAYRNVDETCHKIKVIFRPIRDLYGKKQRKPNLIRSEEKNDIKDKFPDSGHVSKEGRRHQQTQNSNWERERERERETERERQREAKLKTTHQPHWPSSSLLWRKRLTRKSPNIPLFSAPVTSDWPCTRNSNNPTTIKHRTFFLLLIPYQHIFTNPAIWIFYSFVSNTIVKIFMCLRVLCLCNCFICTFFAAIRWYNIRLWWKTTSLCLYEKLKRNEITIGWVKSLVRVSFWYVHQMMEAVQIMGGTNYGL